jgi:NADH-quinone oxidoreductase subunit H
VNVANVWTWCSTPTLPLVWAQHQQIGLGLDTGVKWLLWLVVGFFGLFPGIVAYMVWAERKVAARFQDRIGPNRVGPLGLLQPIADALKLLTKENIVPRTADQWVHILAPVLLLVSAFLVLAVMPFGVGLAPVDLPSGLLYLVAVSSLASLGLFLAGWSSRNKYALLGSMRAVAQLVSYEVPQVLATVPVVLWAGSLSLVTIFDKQLQYGWFLFSPPGVVAFVILLIANIAEVNRTPFDLPEAESEIIAGYHTEYSGMRFGLFFLAEYLSVFGVSCLGTLLFLGGGSLPFTEFPVSILGGTWFSYGLVNLILVSVFAIKVAGFVFLMFWIRATLPRMRVDRLMNFAWKYLVPMSIVNIFASAIWYECYLRSSRPFVIFGKPLSVAWLPMNWIISSLITAAILVPAFLLIVGVNRQEKKADEATMDATRAATAAALRLRAAAPR